MRSAKKEDGVKELRKCRRRKQIRQDRQRNHKNYAQARERNRETKEKTKNKEIKQSNFKSLTVEDSHERNKKQERLLGTTE